MATNVEFLFVLKDKLSSGLKGINKNLEKLDGQLKGTTVRLEHFKKKTENIAKFGNKLKSIGQGLTVGVTLPIVAMGGAMVKAAADMESMQQQLSTMLGSDVAGARMFNSIKTMAAKTPFGTRDLIQATNTMLGFGIAQEKVLPLMNQLGDISGGNAERFQSLALAFSQVSSAGKLQGQDLMQMINAGFNPLESIAKRTGRSVGYWKEQMSKGKVTVQMVEQAMKDATSEGGRFFNMMEKQSKTALGQWSTFQDELNSVLAEFGKLILPDAIKALTKLSEILQYINSLSPRTKKLILIIMGLTAILGPLLITLGLITTSILSINTALGTLSAILGISKMAILGWSAAWIGAIAGVIAILTELIILFKHFHEMMRIKNMDSIRTDNFTDEQLKKLSYEQGMIGKKEFAKKYGKNVSNAVKDYNKNGGVVNNNKNKTINFYGDIKDPRSAMMLQQLLQGGTYATNPS